MRILVPPLAAVKTQQPEVRQRVKDAGFGDTFGGECEPQILQSRRSDQRVGHRCGGVAQPVEPVQPLKIPTAWEGRGCAAGQLQGQHAGAVSQARWPLPIDAVAHPEQHEVLQTGQVLRQPWPSVALQIQRCPLLAPLSPLQSATTR